MGETDKLIAAILAAGQIAAAGQRAPVSADRCLTYLDEMIAAMEARRKGPAPLAMEEKLDRLMESEDARSSSWSDDA